MEKKQKIKQKYYERYHIQVNIGRQSRVETKRSCSTNLLPHLICLTAANETGNQSSFDSDYFTIVVNNHAFKTIYNQRSHFISDF